VDLFVEVLVGYGIKLSDMTKHEMRSAMNAEKNIRENNLIF
jgi:hypothetical protein